MFWNNCITDFFHQYTIIPSYNKWYHGTDNTKKNQQRKLSQTLSNNLREKTSCSRYLFRGFHIWIYSFSLKMWQNKLHKPCLTNTTYNLTLTTYNSLISRSAATATSSAESPKSSSTSTSTTASSKSSTESTESISNWVVFRSW